MAAAPPPFPIARLQPPRRTVRRLLNLLASALLHLHVPTLRTFPFLRKALSFRFLFRLDTDPAMRRCLSRVYTLPLALRSELPSQHLSLPTRGFPGPDSLRSKPSYPLTPVDRVTFGSSRPRLSVVQVAGKSGHLLASIESTEKPGQETARRATVRTNVALLSLRTSGIKLYHLGIWRTWRSEREERKSSPRREPGPSAAHPLALASDEGCDSSNPAGGERATLLERVDLGGGTGG
jgi:hypothetical protein